MFSQINNFEYNLKNGKIGETEISTWLRSKGWNILPAYEIEYSHGKGPRLYMAHGNTELITPDLLVFKESNIRWIEAKNKSAFTWYRNNECWQDGIDSRHWRDYCRVYDLTQWEVWLFFLHKPGAVAKDTPSGLIPPTGLFGERIQILKEKIDHESDRHANGMIYWNIDIFRKLAGWPLNSQKQIEESIRKDYEPI